MSKHIFEQTIEGQTYEVQLGWDKPMQVFYGVISPWVEDETWEEGGYFDDPVWSNLFVEKNLPLGEIEEECCRRGFTIPDGLLENVVSDMVRNAVNEVKYYGDREDKSGPPIEPT